MILVFMFLPVCGMTQTEEEEHRNGMRVERARPECSGGRSDE